MDTSQERIGALVERYMGQGFEVPEAYGPSKKYLRAIAQVSQPDAHTLVLRFNDDVKLTENSDAHGGLSDFVKTMLAKSGRYPGLGMGEDGLADERFYDHMDTELRTSKPVTVAVTLQDAQDMALVKMAVEALQPKARPVETHVEAVAQPRGSWALGS